MTFMPLGLFIKKWQSKVSLAGYDILFTYFELDAKSERNSQKISKISFILFQNDRFFKTIDLALQMPF